MQIIEATRFGAPDVLTARVVPDLVAGPGQAVIGTSAADVLFLDTMIRSGAGRDYFPIRPPYVPGTGVSGHVVGVGAGVDPAWLGRRVTAQTGETGATDGYAGQARVAAEQLIAVPNALGLAEAAALLHDGSTAFALVERADPQPDQWVLVLGATGGLGILSLQLARARGARVIAAARSRRKLELAAR